MIKILKQLLFVAIITVCASFAAYAQKQDKGKTPPKDDPPKVIVNKDKDNRDKKEDKPRNDDRGSDRRGKKPE